MIENINPYQFNLQGDIEVRTVDKSTGENRESFAVQNPNIWMKRLPPPRGTETTEAMQRVSLQRDSFLIREEGLTITAANHRININQKLYYITAVRPYKSSLNMTVLDTEVRDNNETISNLDTPLEANLMG